MLHSDPNLEERFYICSKCSKVYNDEESTITEGEDGFNCICFGCDENKEE